MATEKISIESLPSNLVALPGGISVYDSTGTRSMLLKPSFVSDIKAKGIQSVSSKELEEQGVRIAKGLQLVYPKRQQSLVSFVGTLPAYTLIFTNPSEDTSKHRHELTSEVFQTTTDIELTNAEPTLLNVRRVHDGESIEISRLGHFIALSQQQQPKPSFPPDDLRLYLPPVHIPSQHLGDCAADTIQTALFFADGFQEEFAQRANTVYKNYIHTEQSLLFQVDNPKLKDELRKAYGLSESLPQQEEDALAVFASMVRRYILVRLLDFGTEQEIASLNIPPTTCILPAAVPQMGLVKGRRKSVNLLAGATIARKLSRVFEPSGYLTSNLKLKETEITLLTEHTFFCLLFKLFKQRQMHSMIVELANLFGFESETSKLRAILFPLMQTTKNGGSQSLEAGGHSISMFRFQETWYLQDDNIGIAKPLPQFDPEHFIKTKGNFFISSYTNLTNKSDLIEQGFFTEQELRQGIPQRFVYYGYKYRNGEYFKEKILSKESITYTGRYDAGTTVLFLCFGDIDPESIKGVANQCKAPIEEPALPSTSSESRVKVKVKDLPPDLIAQLTLATPSEKRPNRKSSVPGIRKNIQANLNAFPTTRKTNTANAKNTTRKVKAYTNVKILNQFTAF